MRTQLVAARTVAEVAATLVEGDAPEITEVGGPREESLVEAARLLAAKRGAPATVEGVSDPSDPDSARYKEGAVLPGPGATPRRADLRGVAGDQLADPHPRGRVVVQRPCCTSSAARRRAEILAPLVPGGQIAM